MGIGTPTVGMGYHAIYNNPGIWYAVIWFGVRRTAYMPRNYPRRAAVHRAWICGGEGVAVFMARVHLYTIDRIYKYILYANTYKMRIL